MPTTEPPVIPKINVKVPSTQNYQAAQIRTNWKAIRARLEAIEAAAGTPKSVTCDITAPAIVATFSPAITELTHGMVVSVFTEDVIGAVGEFTFTPNEGLLTPAPVINLNRRNSSYGASSLFPGEMGDASWSTLQYDAVNVRWELVDPAVDALSLIGNAILDAEPVTDMASVLAIPVVVEPINEDFNKVKTVSLAQMAAEVAGAIDSDSIDEGVTNLYFTEERVISVVQNTASIPLMAGGFNEDIIYGVGDNKVPNFITTTDGDLVYVGI